MVCAYYDRTVDGGAEFSGMECASASGFDDSYNRYDVVRLNMQEFLSASHEVEGTLRLLQKGVLRDLAREYRDLDLMTDAGLPFATADIYGQIGRKFVIVIDEWDCVMREKAYDHEAQRAYLDLLRLWLKDRPYVALCYMTGSCPSRSTARIRRSTCSASSACSPPTRWRPTWASLRRRWSRSAVSGEKPHRVPCLVRRLPPVRDAWD